MSTSKGKNLPWDFRGCCGKIVLMIITTVIPLWCGIHDTYGTFYLAVFLQSVNNMYDAYSFLKGFNKTITIFQAASLFGGLICVIISIIYISGYSLKLSSIWGVIICSVFLSIPILHYLIELYILYRNGKY